jgi:hypothetical protein
VLRASPTVPGSLRLGLVALSHMSQGDTHVSTYSREAHRGHKSAHVFCKMKKQKSKIHFLYFKIHILKLVLFSSPPFVNCNTQNIKP